MFWTCIKSFNDHACSVKMQSYKNCFIIYFFDVVAFK